MVLHGTKSSTDKLWLVQLPNSSTIDNPSQLQSNASHLSSDAAFVSFVHASLGSPVYSTFIHAVRSGYLSTWPRLTAAIVNAHPPLTIATAKGHLNQHRQGLDSTKQFPLHDTAIDITDDITDVNDALPHIPVSEASANHTYVKVLPLLQTVSADLTGKFPITANTGAQYVLISEMDRYIHGEPMASRHHTAYTAGFTRTIAFFAALGRSPSF